MKTRLTHLFAFLLIFSGARFSYAQVVINEISLNPTGARFIELFNTSSQTVDLTGWYLQRKTENGTDFGSLVSKTNFKNKNIGADGYFLISRSAMTNAEIVLGDLTLTESNTIQLKNPKGVVVDKVAWGDTNIPNPKDSKSIQKISNAWVIATPTPRAVNAADIIAPAVAIPIVPVFETKTDTEMSKVKTKITTQPEAPIGDTSSIQKIPPSIDLGSQNEANPPENSTNSYLFYSALAFFLVISGGAVYVIRQKKVISKAGDDFEILDE